MTFSEMKIQCNVCEAAEAVVLCCSDEAALCRECDDKVHAANKLASKHQRVLLSSSSTEIPKCDSCQETSGFFFCLQHRALLCRKCDVAMHTVNIYVSAHQRFLLTGVKVGVEPADPGASSSSVKSLSGENISDMKYHSLPRKASMLVNGENNKVLTANDGGVGDFATTKVSFAGGSVAGGFQSWHMYDSLTLTELDQSYGFMENGSSEFFQAEIGKHGDFDSSTILRSAKEELDDDERLGQVPETSWVVPQVNSTLTASGQHWPKDSQNKYDSTFVSDIYDQSRPNGPAKRRRWQL